MDALGEPYQRWVARHARGGRVVRASANAVDKGAAMLAAFIRNYPLGRLGILLYLLLLHGYLWFLTMRMQHVAAEAVGNDSGE
jgi:hypothetical protein